MTLDELRAEKTRLLLQGMQLETVEHDLAENPAADTRPFTVYRGSDGGWLLGGLAGGPYTFAQAHELTRAAIYQVDLQLEQAKA